jgi:hypothetical protein
MNFPLDEFFINRYAASTIDYKRLKNVCQMKTMQILLKYNNIFAFLFFPENF